MDIKKQRDELRKILAQIVERSDDRDNCDLWHTDLQEAREILKNTKED